jgi:hypothetical protein
LLFGTFCYNVLHFFAVSQCGLIADQGFDGYTKPNQVPSTNGTATDITISFADVNLVGNVSVYDIWAQQSLGVFSGSYTAKAVPFHGSAFLRLSAA